MHTSITCVALNQLSIVKGETISMLHNGCNYNDKLLYCDRYQNNVYIYIYIFIFIFRIDVDAGADTDPSY